MRGTGKAGIRRICELARQNWGVRKGTVFQAGETACAKILM